MELLGPCHPKPIPTEAEKQELINAAQGAAEAVVAAGKARAKSIELVSAALGNNNGHNAANLAVAEKYVTAFQELARTNNTLILPSNSGDVTSMVAQVRQVKNASQISLIDFYSFHQAMSIYSNLQKNDQPQHGSKSESSSSPLDPIVESPRELPGEPIQKS